ncbi:uncharacterized protein [Physcomitrium patens]|uniref:Uncharacterized protein n=1 Tax=Physcomitrium patens TaxID=3218 RepID=A0A2K1J7G0_PHYPA|nr:uncharacterized protein LOC112293261 [Physcomitrium patens]PNR37459.1 hypothetical protein PHYPA_020568 [Physcomitrium patens]|eukprot:XP_024398248.1 uncharacterized protein LOC112293261 [Physcomitrella patens]
MDPGSKDRLLRNITIAATALSAALLISTDYGPKPHIFSSFSASARSIKDWFWTPSPAEQEEMQRRLPRQPVASDGDRGSSRDVEKQ